jgi:hypothetical protein
VIHMRKIDSVRPKPRDAPSRVPNSRFSLFSKMLECDYAIMMFEVARAGVSRSGHTI